ncbi:hypothetical protein D3C72_1846230 [compost metagenome]
MGAAEFHTRTYLIPRTVDVDCDDIATLEDAAADIVQGCVGCKRGKGRKHVHLDLRPERPGGLGIAVADVDGKG